VPETTTKPRPALRGSRHIAQIRKVAALSAKPPDGPGLSIAQIAKKLKVSERQVSNLRAAAKEQLTPDLDAEVYFPLDPVPEENQSWQAKATVHDGRRWLEWVREHPDEKVPSDLADCALAAFERFYVRYSGRYFPDHWRQWVRDALTHDRLLLNVPPRHAKSELFSVWFPIWLVTLDRNIQILVISETGKVAKKFAGKVAWHLEYNGKLVSEQGRFRPDAEAAPWRPLTGELLVHGRNRQTESGDLTLQIRGMEQQILGMEADIIIGDDVVGPDSRNSEVSRDSLSEKWHGDVMSRQSPNGRVIVVGQRIHFLDLYGELAEKVDEFSGEVIWHHIVTPAVIRFPSTDPETGEAKAAIVLWEREWPYPKLMKRKADVTRRKGAQLWETMFQQNPLPPQGVTVKPEWINGDSSHRGCLDRDRPGGVPATLQTLIGVAEDMEIPDDLRMKHRPVRIMSLDPPQERAGGLIIADVLEDREVFTCGIIEAHRLRPGIQEVHRLVREKAGLYSPDYLLIEQNGAQRWFKEDPGFVAWHRRTNIRLLPHATGVNKQNPEWGQQSLAVDFELGRIRLPFGDADGRSMSTLLIDEVTKHPYAEYDDLFMALWFPKFNLPKLIAPRTSGADPRKRQSNFHVPPRLKKAGWRGFTR
jgi:hypothetical protein